MSRGYNKIKKRIILPDVCYHSTLVTRFINKLMKCGKKSIAERIVYKALSLAEKKLGEDALFIFNNAVKNVTPTLEARSRRVGGATYQVPVEVRKERAVSLALRWIVKAVRAARKGKSTSYYLYIELVNAYNKRGEAFKICEDKYKAAISYRVYSHLNF
ncbi:30S ribosomal protein S7 [Candidatus Mesenet endosymbiont of Agriotes lineatus]|uniref:30S ribosomal protein S7 n=1 Tax=Candidatus Mesenet endosymbiont of Agriotes lineatus TaxID=3077948 RepID=UPI0030D3C3BB